MREGIANIIKFLLAIAIVPAVIGAVKAFYAAVILLQPFYGHFARGVLCYVLLHLFLYSFEGPYEFGQRIFLELFRFSSPLASAIPAAIPFYAVLSLLGMYVTVSLLGWGQWAGILAFAAGFSLCMHVILCAHHLFESDPNTVKTQYFLSFGLMLIAVLVLMAALLDLNFSAFSFMAFWSDAVTRADGMYAQVWTKLGN